MRRRYLGLAATGLVAAMTLTACGSGAGEGPVTLTLVAADYGSSDETSSRHYWEDLAEKFTDTHPDIRLDVRVHDWEAIDGKVAEMVDKGDVPDIVQAGSYAGYASRDMLYSADELLSVPVQSDFIPSIADAGDYRRRQYGIPFVSSSRLLFYNRDLFERAGVDRAPRTWDELKRAAEKLKEAGVEMPYGLPLGPEEPQAEAMLWMLGGGGGYTRGGGGYAFTSEANVSTFAWLKENLVDPGLTGADPAGTNREEVFGKFLRGEVGMLNGHPTLTGAAKEAGIDYAVAAVPGRDGELNETLGVADWMMAFKENGHGKQIGEFLDFVYAEKNTLEFLHRHDLLPVTTTAAQAMSEEPELEPVRPFLDKLQNARFYPAGDPVWTRVSAEVKKHIGKAVTGDPKDVLQRLQTYADEQTSLERGRSGTD
ncbi:extracellular solute-binding protein [Streptomyces capparidis]